MVRLGKKRWSRAAVCVRGGQRGQQGRVGGGGGLEPGGGEKEGTASPAVLRRSEPAPVTWVAV